MDIPKPYRTRTFDMLIRNETAASSENRETDTALRLLSPCRPLSAALRSTESLPNNRGTNRRLTEKLPAYWKRPGTASGKDAERSAGTPLFSNGAFLAAIRATTGDVSNFQQRPVPKTPSATSASDISGPSAILRRVRPKRGRSHFVRQRLGNNLRSVVVAPHAGDLVERGDDLPRIGQRDQL